MDNTLSEVHIKGVEEAHVDTVLAEDIDFTGELHFAKPLMIKGRFKGEILATGDLYVGDQAEVEARIEANIVSLKGKVKGDITARSRIELFASSQVEGDITAPDIVMESGCRFNGICTMTTPLPPNQ